MVGGRRRAMATVGGRVRNRRRRDRVAREFRVASATTKSMQPVDRDEGRCDLNRCESLTWVLWTMPMCDATGREWGAVAFGGSAVPAVVDRCTGQRWSMACHGGHATLRPGTCLACSSSSALFHRGVKARIGCAFGVGTPDETRSWLLTECFASHHGSTLGDSTPLRHTETISLPSARAQVRE